MTRTSSSTSTPAGFSRAPAEQPVGRQPSASASAQAAYPAPGGLRQCGASGTGPSSEARPTGVSAPRLRHLSADQIREAQGILRREGPGAYPRLEGEAQAAGCFSLSLYVNDRGESTDFGKKIKRQATEDRLRDHAIRAGAASTLLATAGIAVVVSPLGHAFRRAGERLNREPERMFSNAPQSGQPANPPPEEEFLPPYPGGHAPG